MDKFSRGLRLARTSFRVVAADPVILLVLLAGVIGAVGLSGGLFFAIFGRLPNDGDFTWPRDEQHALSLAVVGNRLQAWIDDELIFDLYDYHRPLSGGAVGLLCEEGRIAVGPVRIHPAG